MKKAIIAAAFAFALTAAPAHAQTTDPVATALKQCVVASTSHEDGVVTASWLFIAMSRHPDLPQSARVSDADGLVANRQMGALVNRLLFRSCATEARAAVAAFGMEATFQIAFSTLGETAMAHLMNNPDVLASVMQLGAYVDRDRLVALATGQ